MKINAEKQIEYALESFKKNENYPVHSIKRIMHWSLYLYLVYKENKPVIFFV